MENIMSQVSPSAFKVSCISEVCPNLTKMWVFFHVFMNWLVVMRVTLLVDLGSETKSWFKILKHTINQCFFLNFYWAGKMFSKKSITVLDVDLY